MPTAVRAAPSAPSGVTRALLTDRKTFPDEEHLGFNNRCTDALQLSHRGLSPGRPQTESFCMTSDQLRACTKKELTEMARKKGLAGWHAMRKEELIEALASKSQRKSSRSQPQAAAARNTSSSSTAEEQVERSKYDVGVPTKDLSVKVPKHLPAGYGKDRIVVMVRDPYWLHAYWELTRSAIQRAEAALGQDWHGARPILRVIDVSSQETTSTSESIIRDIDIHGGCNNWYIDVNHPPKSFRIDIGYLSKRGQFYVLARSNVVSTPRAGVSDLIDENWADIDTRSADRIYAMSGGFSCSWVGPLCEWRWRWASASGCTGYSPISRISGSGCVCWRPIW